MRQREEVQEVSRTGALTGPEDPPAAPDLANGDRPRERLRQVGSRGVSNRELLAALVGSGGRAGSATEIADRVLARAGGSLRRLTRLSPAALERIPGVGRAVSSRIAAAAEIGRRAEAERLEAGLAIQGPEDVCRVMGPQLRSLAQEEFHALLLDRRHRLIRDVLVTRGLLDASLIHAREVFREAIVEHAAAVLLVHNHPSGDPTPSAEDRAVTEALVGAGEALGIPVLDHVIVAERGCRSLLTGARSTPPGAAARVRGPAAAGLPLGTRG
ncbi:MAG: DNA repair protein RadC [Gemmatimonadota bacterium]